ncbi:MAG: hypothetical protein ABEJ95_03295 [Candidatus Nanohalobium sp.]
MVEALKPSKKDALNMLLAGLVVGTGFAAYRDVTSPGRFMAVTLLGPLAVFFRELGQRTVAHFMEADVHTELSTEGSVTTLLVAFLSYISVFSLALLIPVSSGYSNRSYENWGKGIDAIWAKREYWLAASGITTLLIAWLLSFIAGFQVLAEMTALFAFFQLLPLDEEKSFCGKLDGAYIILWSGFMWLIFTGLTIIALTVSVL